MRPLRPVPYKKVKCVLNTCQSPRSTRQLTSPPHHAFIMRFSARILTVFLYLNDLPGNDAGGETHFPLLNVSVSPRKGDALVWANVDSDGVPEPRSLHEGRAPADGYTKIAVNCWVADRPFDLGSTMDKAVRMGD